MRENFLGETGNEAERAHFGSTDPSATTDSIARLVKEESAKYQREGRSDFEFRQNVIEAFKQSGQPPHRDFPLSLAIARKCQERGASPDNPKQPYAHELRKRSLELIQAFDPHVTRIGFFTTCSSVSAGTGKIIRLTADFYHSTDAFLDIYDNNPNRPNKNFPERRTTITIDGTINPHKNEDQRSKANIITTFPQELDPVTDLQGFVAFVEQEAQKVLQQYKLITEKRNRPRQ